MFTFDCYFMFPCSGMCVEINLDRNFSGAALLRLRSIWKLEVRWSIYSNDENFCIMDVSSIWLEITLICLALNKILDKCISGLGIQRQGVLQRFQVLAFVDVAHFQTDASGVEVLFYHFKRVL